MGSYSTKAANRIMKNIWRKTSKGVEGHLNPELFNPKLQPRTFQPQTFQPWTFQPRTFQPWIFEPWGWKVHGWKVWGWKVRGWNVISLEGYVLQAIPRGLSKRTFPVTSLTVHSVDVLYGCPLSTHTSAVDDALWFRNSEELTAHHHEKTCFLADQHAEE